MIIIVHFSLLQAANTQPFIYFCTLIASLFTFFRIFVGRIKNVGHNIEI